MAPKFSSTGKLSRNDKTTAKKTPRRENMPQNSYQPPKARETAARQETELFMTDRPDRLVAMRITKNTSTQSIKLFLFKNCKKQMSKNRKKFP